MKNREFLKKAFFVDLIIVIVLISLDKTLWLLNIQVAFISSLIITFATFYSYKQNVLKGIPKEQERFNDDPDIIDKLDDPYDLYSSQIDETIYENPTKEQILEAKKPIKQNYIKNLKSSILSYTSFYRIGGYIVLIIGFFYLNNNNLFQAWSYLVGFLIMPLSMLMKHQK